MKVKEVLSTTLFKTCVVRKEIIEAPYGGDHEWKAAYSVIDGSYIGDCKSAEVFERRKIMPQRKRPDCKTASIGFCEKEQKWYGWSHRAMYGFGIGSEVKKGNCSYKPDNPKNLMDSMVRFWVDGEDEFVTKTIILQKKLDVIDPNNNRPGLGAILKTERTRKKDSKVLDGVYWEPYPSNWGKGEWKAKTLEDAKQMAIDFSDGVS